MTDPVKFRYQAFLSYSHRDVEQGTKLHAALENYRVPADLVGRPGAHGVTPSRLRPIFRDRFDLEAGHSLRDQVIDALKSSAALIVLCSPNSAKSTYVNEEVRLFKMLGRSDRIYPVIVDGEPGDAERECFPANLSRVFDAKGAPTGEVVEPLAADMRAEGDGEELAKFKLIAGLLGIDLDDLRKREAVEQRKQRRHLAMVAGAMSVLAVAAVAFGIGSWVLKGQLQEANQHLEQTNQQLQTALDNEGIARKEAEERYAQALTSNLQVVTIAATFNSVVTRRPFALMQINAKLANTDFNRFVTAAGENDAVWVRLVEVLNGFAKELPPELAPIENLLKSNNMQRQWVEHSELIMSNLVQRTDKPDYKTELTRIREELVRLGGQPRRDPECAPLQLDSQRIIMMQQTAPCVPQRLTPATAN
jgi:hypothetical protein